MLLLRFRFPDDDAALNVVVHLKRAALHAGAQVRTPVFKNGEVRVLLHLSQSRQETWVMMATLRYVESLTYPNPEGF